MIAFKDAFALHSKGSIILQRMVQCVVYNKESSYEEIKMSTEWLDNSIMLKKKEKIYNGEKAM